MAQVVAIVVVSRVIAIATRRLDQPLVIAEMIGGILLGPSLLGRLLPEFSAVLFAPESLGALRLTSQFGLVFFMFLVGIELDTAHFRRGNWASIAISQSGILTPFVLGSALALWMYPRYGSATTSRIAFALFTGAAMSVTAFPVLARILVESRLLETRIGAITITCAAIDDVTAWCILAFIVGIARHRDASSAILTTAFAAGYVIVAVGLVRPALARLARRITDPDAASRRWMPAVLVAVLLSSWTTEAIGIHALFGGFLFGAILPRERGFASAIAQRLEDLVVVVFLPLFFALSGLNTQIDLVTSNRDWAVCGVVVLVACAGKLGGCSVAARVTGFSWREAGMLGVLMNTRGLMELIVLNIGLEIGVISPVVFSMMVLMALITTFLTTPVLRWIAPPAA
ncbi:MAG TPA: cation:proton antiporter [Kofleriaceae bacterium]